MIDKNGTEIHTGDIVLIKNTPNRTWAGLFFVKASPGDPLWEESHLLLHRISDTGDITTSYRGFPESTWPVQLEQEEPEIRKRLEKATIEHYYKPFDKSQLATWFIEESHRLQEEALIMRRQYGEGSEEHTAALKASELMQSIALRYNQESHPYRFYFDADGEDDEN